jgi:Ca2+-binding EF-hand superfamily protein
MALTAESFDIQVKSFKMTWSRHQLISPVLSLPSYTQELPSRFKKDIVRAASQDRESIIALQDVQRVLQNIGADNRLTSEEIRSIFQEIGNKSGEMTVQHFMQIL